MKRLSRRQFVQTTTAGAAGVALAGRSVPALHRSREIDELYDRAIVADPLTNERWEENEGMAAWRKSGYTVIQTTLRSGAGARGRFQGEFWSEGNFETAMRSLEEWQERFRRRPDVFIHCTKATDIEHAKREGKLAVILGFQNAPVGDDVSELVDLYKAGTRCIQLTYMSRNKLGDGCLERIQSGLSTFGIACVEKMNELGIIVDLSHCSEGTTSDGIAFSRQPVAFTHTVCQEVYRQMSGGMFHLRAKSDRLLRALGDKGGFVGITTLGYFVGPSASTSLDDYLNHIAHAAKVCGIEHVGVCTDHAIRGIQATGATRETWLIPRLRKFHSLLPRWPPWIPDLDTPDRFRTVAHALAGRGFKTGDIEKILGGNWLRYCRDVFRG